MLQKHAFFSWQLQRDVDRLYWNEEHKSAHINKDILMQTKLNNHKHEVQILNIGLTGKRLRRKNHVQHHKIYE